MKSKEIVKGNLLIAKFMGFDYDSERNVLFGYDVDEFSNGISPEELVYDESWDWLVPVVIKITKTRVSEIKQPGLILCLGDLTLSWNRISIDEVWNSIVKFITRYNNYKSG